MFSCNIETNQKRQLSTFEWNDDDDDVLGDDDSVEKSQQRIRGMSMEMSIKMGKVGVGEGRMRKDEDRCEVGWWVVWISYFSIRVF